MIEFAIAHINPALFKEQLNAALGYAPPFQTTQNDDSPAIITIARESLVLGDEVLVQDVIDVHDSKQLTEAQEAERDVAERKEAALEALALADPDALLAQAAAADSLEALCTVIQEMAVLMQALLALAEAR